MEKMTREHTHADTQRPTGADGTATRADIPHSHRRGDGGWIYLIFMWDLNGALTTVGFFLVIFAEKV